MKTKKFHLNDFPEERIRILLKNNRKFIDESISYFDSLKELASFLLVSPGVIQHWKKLNLFIPLQHIKKIVNERKLDWNEIEKNVVAYKGPNLSLEVRNPKLPVIESPELFAIIAHLIADGSVNKNGIPIYTNSNKELIDNFQKLIRFVFGDIQGSLYKSRSGSYQFRYSRIIADLISSFYDISFNSLTANIPSRIKELPAEFSISFVRAFADDEGNVDFNHRINVYSKNKKILEDIRYLLKRKLMFKDVTPVLTRLKNHFYMTIRAKELEKYHALIGFNHPLKKTKLSQIIEIRKNFSGLRRKDGQTKNEILKLLSSRNLSTEELIIKLGIRSGNVGIPLKELKNKGLIGQLDKNGQKIIWTRMEG